jgi:antitoxin (DNA-binding transcriptional repressor) of toxin-antitoxin stability system
VSKEITQRQLRNDSGEVMRGLDSGDSFVVTRNGVAVGQLTPISRRRFVSREAALTAFAAAAAIDGDRFREDLDAEIDQDPTPRA